MTFDGLRRKKLPYLVKDHAVGTDIDQGSYETTDSCARVVITRAHTQMKKMGRYLLFQIMPCSIYILCQRTYCFEIQSIFCVTNEQA